MTDKRTNIHGTAFRINDIGILCVGASGCGKSELVFSMIAEATRWGASAALIADDQVLLSIDQQSIVAHRPTSTAGLIELRGSGIFEIDSEESVVLVCVITPELCLGNERLPPMDERYHFASDFSLPLYRIPAHSLTPYAKFSAFVADLCRDGTIGGQLLQK